MTHRIERVNELIRRELSTVLGRDYAFGGVIATVHDVQITPDFKSCRVWIGLLGGNEHQQEIVIEKLRLARGAIQNELFKRVKLKTSPQLFFRHDKSVERGVRIVQAIDNLPPPSPDSTGEPAPPFREPRRTRSTSAPVPEAAMRKARTDS